MKYQTALESAKAEARARPGLVMVVVNEGIHNPEREFDGEVDDPSFGWCPRGGEDLLYRYGVVVTTLLSKGGEFVTVVNARDFEAKVGMKAEELLALHVGKPVSPVLTRLLGASESLEGGGA